MCADFQTHIYICPHVIPYGLHLITHSQPRLHPPSSLCSQKTWCFCGGKSHLDDWYCSIVSSWGPFQGPLPSQQGFCVLTSIAHHIFITLGGSQGITTKTSGKTRSSVLSLFLCVCVCVLIVQSCPTPYNPRDCSPSGSSVYGILQERILEWVAIPFSQGSSRPRDWTQISCIAGRSLYHLSHQGRPRALQPG